MAFEQHKFLMFVQLVCVLEERNCDVADIFLEEQNKKRPAHRAVSSHRVFHETFTNRGKSNAAGEKKNFHKLSYNYKWKRVEKTRKPRISGIILTNSKKNKFTTKTSSQILRGKSSNFQKRK